MNIWWRIVFWSIFIFSTYHLARDVLQIFDLHSVFTNVAHWPHTWCGQYCDSVTLPTDVIGMVGSAIVLLRRRVGVLGAIVLATIPALIIMTLLP